MRSLNVGLQQQYHECVPLGWEPVPVAGSYYPGYSSEYREHGVWLHPFWIGVIYRTQLADPRIRTIRDVLDALARAGMVQRTSMGSATFYRLTPRATHYYFEDNNYGDNPDHMPYLCYSSIVPVKILSVRRISPRSFRTEFVWHVTAPAAWASDPFIRSHSIVLPPLTTPASAELVDDRGDWYLHQIRTSTWMLPRVVDASVWPS